MADTDGTEIDDGWAQEEGEPEKATQKRSPERSPKAKKRPIRREQEPPLVVGGRFLTVAGIIAAATLIPGFAPLAVLLEPTDPSPPGSGFWEEGKTQQVLLTVITADYGLLSCSSERSFEGHHCANKTETQVWPHEPGTPLDNNKANIIQPYRTWLDNRLILVSGLWATPDVATRLHREPSQGMQPDKLARFVADCQVRFVGKLEKPALRWNPQWNWATEDSAMVGIAESCKIVTEPAPECPSGPVCALLNLF